MSGVPPDVILEPRLGPRISSKRQRKFIGQDVAIWIDVRSVLTGQLVPGAAGAAAWYRFYVANGDDAPDQPLEVTEPTPGTLHVVVPGDLPGTCDVGFQIEGPNRAASHITFEVASTGGITVTASGVIPYGDVQSVAVAAALSAVRPEVRRVAVEVSTVAAEEAVDKVLDGIGEGAADAAVRAVAQQLSVKADVSVVTALGQEVNRKANADAVDVLGQAVERKADTSAVDAVARQVTKKADAAAVAAATGELDRRVTDLEAAGPPDPPPFELTALTIAKALGWPVYDFRDPRNSALLAL